MADDEVYCTLVMSDDYLPGAAVLAHSLRDCGATRKLACLVSTDSLRASTIDQLRTLYDHLIFVSLLGNPTPNNLHLMNRTDLLFAFTKIQLWRQTRFRKIVYIDADVVALRAPEELFETTEDFAAAPDVGWPDIFNTGVMVLTPNDGDFRALQNMAAAGDSFDGADQGLLNQYFEHKPWKRLSFAYNCTPSANYQYEPAYRYYKHKISLVHFIGRDKPWKNVRSANAHPGAYKELLSRWWAVYDRHIEVNPHEYIDGVVKKPEPIAQPHHESTASEIQLYKEPATAELPITEEQSATQTENVETMPEPKHEFTAPSMEWDATRAPPPASSKPEAANFPTQIYKFNTDVEAFHPPATYPAPPKNMWYEVPSQKPRVEEKPPPIFPWEERSARPTRKFADDDLQQPVPDEPEFAITSDEFEVSDDVKTITSEPSITINDTRTAAAPTTKNAWDEVSGIDSYVRALTSWQKNRGKVQVIHNTQANTDQQQIMSPIKDIANENLEDTVRERRESLILTDFPTAIERPSLPVTPAPRRRTTFWGDERDDAGNLPSAEGVPDQIDWDPSAQLEQLRRNSLLGPEGLKLPSTKPIPDRQEISPTIPVPSEAVTSHDSEPAVSNSGVGAAA